MVTVAVPPGVPNARPDLIRRRESAFRASRVRRDRRVARKLKHRALLRDDGPVAGVGRIEGVPVANREGPRGEIDSAGDGGILGTKTHEDRVPIASGHRIGLRILDADDVEVVMRAVEVDATWPAKELRRQQQRTSQ